jgi:hypothetical protein
MLSITAARRCFLVEHYTVHRRTACWLLYAQINVGEVQPVTLEGVNHCQQRNDSSEGQGRTVTCRCAHRRGGRETCKQQHRWRLAEASHDVVQSAKSLRNHAGVRTYLRTVPKVPIHRALLHGYIYIHGSTQIPSTGAWQEANAPCCAFG